MKKVHEESRTLVSRHRKRHRDSMAPWLHGSMGTSRYDRSFGITINMIVCFISDPPTTKPLELNLKVSTDAINICIVVKSYLWISTPSPIPIVLCVSVSLCLCHPGALP